VQKFSRESQGDPKISIIVAVLNGVATLQRCIDSIAVQTYPYKELIIMDGGSTDGTITILKKNQEIITYWESSLDRGIYHAFNKAILLANGDYVCFLGADDYWADSASIDKLAQAAIINQFPDFVSGKVSIVNKYGAVVKIMGESWHSVKMKKCMVVAHPGMLHQQNVFRSFGVFSEKYKIASDYEFLLRCNGKTTSVFIDNLLVFMDDGGTSNKNIATVFCENFKIQSARNDIGLARACMNYCIVWLKFIAKRILILFGHMPNCKAETNERY
jgi:glycosyltransferase involved in cell wall biosynthesis